MKKNFNKEEYKEQKREETAEIMAKLEQGIKDVFTSDKFKEFLTVMSRFHNYSINNTVLIMQQNSGAERVAGYNTWKELGRQVRKGEKAIKILAPSSFKKEVQVLDEKGNIIIGDNGKPKTEIKEIRYFKQVSVFDVGQTDGKELPSLVNELKGNVEEKEAIYKALTGITGLLIQEEKIKGKAKGYYQPASISGEGEKIVVKKGMEDLQSIKTAIHETAHCLLHDPNKETTNLEESRNAKEVQAESVAYVVASKLGLDTGEYSFGYIASWSTGKQLEELKASLQTIQKTADSIYSAIEKELGNLKNLDKVLQESIEDKTIVEILRSESSDFASGELLDIKEANSKFYQIDCKVQELNKAAIEKGEDYQPYYKTRFNIKTQIDGKECNYAGRYDLGDGEGYLINHIKNELEVLKDHTSTLSEPKEKAENEKKISFVEGKLIPKLEKEIGKESITKKLEKAKETLSKGRVPKSQEKDQERGGR